MTRQSAKHTCRSNCSGSSPRSTGPLAAGLEASTCYHGFPFSPRLALFGAGAAGLA